MADGPDPEKLNTSNFLSHWTHNAFRECPMQSQWDRSTGTHVVWMWGFRLVVQKERFSGVDVAVPLQQRRHRHHPQLSFSVKKSRREANPPPPPPMGPEGRTVTSTAPVVRFYPKEGLFTRNSPIKPVSPSREGSANINPVSQLCSICFVLTLLPLVQMLSLICPFSRVSSYWQIKEKRFFFSWALVLPRKSGGPKAEYTIRIWIMLSKWIKKSLWKWANSEY